MSYKNMEENHKDAELETCVLYGVLRVQCEGV